MTDDDFVDVGLRKLFRLDLVFLASAEQVIEEGHLELQDFDELDYAAVSDVELAVEVERARIGVRAVDRDLPIVDVTRELRRVLVLFVFRLERADSDAVLLSEHKPAHLYVVHDLKPVALVPSRKFSVHLAARRAEVAFDLNPKSRIAAV